MTIRITTKDGVARAMACLSDDLAAGLVDGCSLYYQDGKEARMSVRYKFGAIKKSALPGMVGADVDVDEDADTEVGKEPK